MRKSFFLSTILFLSLVINGCSTFKIQNDAFNVLSTYCYGDECFEIQKVNSLKYYNSNIPDGTYKIEKEVISNENNGKETVEKKIITVTVNGEIVTTEYDTFLAQHNQKDHRIINFIDKSGTLSKKQVNTAKNEFKGTLSESMIKDVSSGDTIKFNSILADFFLNNIFLVHGLTNYQDKQYLLIETRGTGKVFFTNIKCTFGGYVLLDNTHNFARMKIMDFSAKDKTESATFKIILNQKLIKDESVEQTTPIQHQSEKTTASSPVRGDTYTEPVTGMEFVWVEGGCYHMGSNSGDSDEKPIHKVCVDGFWMAKYEVTQGQWQKIMGSNSSYFKNCGNDCPVEQVSWNDAKQFITNLNSRSNVKFRLPTEAEWEYAARSGGKNEKYAGGNNVDSVAWYGSNSSNRIHQIGTKAPNGLGIYDMSGNVLEWCEDVYDEKAYNKHATNNPLVTSGSEYRVIRGGGWGSPPAGVSCANRIRIESGDTRNGVGFRLCSPQVLQ